jgi:protein-disulfide isomerase
MIYHGRISYSILDNFINNRAKDNINYILKEDDNKHIRFDADGYYMLESNMNEWVQKDIYSNISQEHCHKMIQSEAVKISQIFKELKLKGM